MNTIQFAKKIKNRECVFGTCITMPSPHMVNYIDALGTDFLFIDTEHIPQNREKVAWMCHAFKGQPVIVRVPEPDEFEASKVIDAGATAVLIPYTENIEKVKRIGATIKYRPLKGKKLDDVISGKLTLEANEKAYLEKFNAGRMLFINIESVEGISKLDEMLKTGYVDAVIIGPHDLSVSLGIPEDYENERFELAVLEIIDICVKNNVSMGNHFSSNRERHIKWSQHGLNIVLNSSDMVSFVETTKNDMAYLRSIITKQTTNENNIEVVI